MLHLVTLFRTLAIVEPVECADQITRNPADALKTYTLADHSGFQFGDIVLFHNSILLTFVHARARHPLLHVLYHYVSLF